MRWERPMVLAVPQDAGQPRGQSADLHSEGERVCAESSRKIAGGTANEHAAGDPLRCSGNSALYWRLRDRQTRRTAAWSTIAIASSATATCTSATGRWCRPTWA